MYKKGFLIVILAFVCLSFPSYPDNNVALGNYNANSEDDSEENHSVPSYSGTILTYYYKDFDVLNMSYTSYRKRYDKIYQLDRDPPYGIYSAARNECLEAAKKRASDSDVYCLVIYENYKGFLFIGIYEYMENIYGSKELKNTNFITYFKVYNRYIK